MRALAAAPAWEAMKALSKDNLAQQPISALVKRS